jgi:hypothetical protein
MIVVCDTEEAVPMTKVFHCQMIDCRNIDRDESSCILEAVEIGSKDRACLSYESDYEYLRLDLKRRVERQ